MDGWVEGLAVFGVISEDSRAFTVKIAIFFWGNQAKNHVTMGTFEGFLISLVIVRLKHGTFFVKRHEN